MFFVKAFFQAWIKKILYNGEKKSSKIKKDPSGNDQGSLTDIDPSLNGQVLNATVATSHLLVGIDGSVQHGKLIVSRKDYVKDYAPPIRSIDGTRCVTSTKDSDRISFDFCNSNYQDFQRWTLKSNQVVQDVVNGKGKKLSCLDVGVDNSIRRNTTCDSKSETQKWSWVNGYLRYDGPEKKSY
jgi:hypothetical protein